MPCPDVNILVSAHRTDFPNHVFYADWLRSPQVRQGLIGLSPLVAASFVRIVTELLQAPARP